MTILISKTLYLRLFLQDKWFKLSQLKELHPWVSILTTLIRWSTSPTRVLSWETVGVLLRKDPRSVLDLRATSNLALPRSEKISAASWSPTSTLIIAPLLSNLGIDQDFTQLTILRSETILTDFWLSVSGTVVFSLHLAIISILLLPLFFKKTMKMAAFNTSMPVKYYFI